MKIKYFLIPLIVLTIFYLTFWNSDNPEAAGDAENPLLSRQIFLESKVDQTEVPFNDLLWLVITLDWVGKKDDIEIAPPSFTRLEDFKITEKSAWKLLNSSQGLHIVSEYRFLLKPLSMGSQKKLPPVKIEYRATNDRSDVQTLFTKPLQIDVLPPLRSSLGKLSIAGITISIFGLIFLIIFAFTFIRRMYQREQIVVHGLDDNSTSLLAKNLPRNGSHR